MRMRLPGAWQSAAARAGLAEDEGAPLEEKRRLLLETGGVGAFTCFLSGEHPHCGHFGK